MGYVKALIIGGQESGTGMGRLFMNGNAAGILRERRAGMFILRKRHCMDC